MGSCERCKYQNKREHEEPCCGCTHNAMDNFKPLTNADRIRSMTDEELAEFLYDTATGNECCICEFKKGWSCVRKDGETCCDGVMEWLKSEEGLEE